jgi:hypothetical protein
VGIGIPPPCKCKSVLWPCIILSCFKSQQTRTHSMLSHDVHSRQTQSRGGWRLDQLGRQYRSDRARSTIRPDPRRPAQMARHSCCRCCCHYDWWVCCCCWWWLSSTPRLRTWSAVSAKRLAWCASHGQKSSCEGAQRAGTEGSAAWLGCYHWMLLGQMR